MRDVEIRTAAAAASSVPHPDPGPAWLALLGAVVPYSALGVLALPGLALLFFVTGVHGEHRDLWLFLSGVVLLPPLGAAAVIRWVRPAGTGGPANRIETVLCWSATLALAAMACAPLLIRMGGLGDRLRRRFAAGVVPTALTSLETRETQALAFILAFTGMAVMLFWVDPADPYLNVLVRTFIQPPFDGSPAPVGRGMAIIAGALAVAAAVVLSRYEARMLRRADPRLSRVRGWAMGLAVLATPMVFFDYSLTADPLHYLTNIGPALHVLHGGTQMVDVFSQYGPGPVGVTAASFLIGPATFGTAQVTVQAFNFVYYALWLTCLFRMSRLKLPSLLLGLGVIALFFAAWAHGYGNVNDAPSVLGFRYWPSLVMVLALSCLPSGRRHSRLTAIGTAAAGVWSVETLVGTLGIHAGFLVLAALRTRSLRRVPLDLLAAAAPAAVAQAALAVLTFAWAGTMPDYRTYLAFLSTYNMLEWPWAISADPRFYGWIGMLLAIYIVLGDAWVRAMDPARRITSLDDRALFHAFVPMALLLALQGAYFVARSVDYTLVMALLPFGALAIPAGVALVEVAWSEKGVPRLLALGPCAACVWAGAFSAMSLLRPHYSIVDRPCPDLTRCASAPYSLIVHECRDHGRCTPAALARGLADSLRARPGLERVGNPRGDYWFDRAGLARDAVAAIEAWAGDDRAITVLLSGQRPDDFLANEIALMYTGTWHRWPRSFTFSDELVDALARRILAAPIRLRAGELVVVRRDEDALGRVDAGILRRIRAEDHLCPIDQPSAVVAAYRVAGPSGC
jgi:hypothetical protein